MSSLITHNKTGSSQFLAGTLKHIVLVLVFSASTAASHVALAQQTAQVTNKIPADGSIPNPTTDFEVWPANVQIEHLSDVGRHKAVVFSPDFAEPGNRQFYERLGFLYIEDANWLDALNQIVARNYWHREDHIETIILETHGTNGNGLKLQTGPAPRAARSYISIGALQEKLEGIGVRLCVVGACNSGRLFRPEIYKTLDPKPHDRLFLPPTLGIINASIEYDPARSKMTVVRRAESEIETTTDGDTSELLPLTRIVLGLEQEDRPVRVLRRLRFAVSNLLIQMLIHDPRLQLTSSGYAKEKSRNDLSEDESDVLFQRFLSYLDGVAAREYQSAHEGQGPVPTSAPALLTGPAALARVIPRSGRYNSRTSRAALLRSRKRAHRRVVD
jgi:hypothetical protein